MLTVCLWEKLNYGAPQHRRLSLEELRQLSERPLPERVLFLSLLWDTYAEADEAMKAAILLCFRGMHSRATLQWIGEQVEHPAAKVRLAAWEALAAAKDFDLSLWLLAALSPDPALRLASLTREHRHRCRVAYLLRHDPAAGTEAMRILGEERWPASVIESFYQEAMDREADLLWAVEPLASSDWKSWIQDKGLVRVPEKDTRWMALRRGEAERFLASAFCPRVDFLIRMAQLGVDAGFCALRTVLVDAIRDLDIKSDQQEFLFALVRRGIMRAEWDSGWLAVCLRRSALLVFCPLLPVELRRRVLARQDQENLEEDLPDLADRKIPDTFKELIVDADGTVHWTVVMQILRLLKLSWLVLQRMVSREEIVLHMAEHPADAEWALFLTGMGLSPQCKLLSGILEIAPELGRRLPAVLLLYHELDAVLGKLGLKEGWGDWGAEFDRLSHVGMRLKKDAYEEKVRERFVAALCKSPEEAERFLARVVSSPESVAGRWNREMLVGLLRSPARAHWDMIRVFDGISNRKLLVFLQAVEAENAVPTDCLHLLANLLPVSRLPAASSKPDVLALREWRERFLPSPGSGTHRPELKEALGNRDKRMRPEMLRALQKTPFEAGDHLSHHQLMGYFRTRGVCEALSNHPPGDLRCDKALLLILGSGDSFEEMDGLLGQIPDLSAADFREVSAYIEDNGVRTMECGAGIHLMRYLFEGHLFALTERLEGSGGWADFVERIPTFSCPVLQGWAWGAFGRYCMIQAYRAPAEMLRLAGENSAVVLKAFPEMTGPYAREVLDVFRACAHVDFLKSLVRHLGEMLQLQNPPYPPDLRREVDEVFGIQLRPVMSSASGDAVHTEADGTQVELIENPEGLLPFLWGKNLEFFQNALARIPQFGEAGLRCVLDRLFSEAFPPYGPRVCECLTSNDHPAGFQKTLRQNLLKGRGSAEVRLHLTRFLLQQGWKEGRHVLSAILEEREDHTELLGPWLQHFPEWCGDAAEDWLPLYVRCPQPLAWVHACKALIALGPIDGALREMGEDLMLRAETLPDQMTLELAEAWMKAGSRVGFPLIFANWVGDAEKGSLKFQSSSSRRWSSHPGKRRENGVRSLLLWGMGERPCAFLKILLRETLVGHPGNADERERLSAMAARHVPDPSTVQLLKRVDLPGLSQRHERVAQRFAEGMLETRALTGMQYEIKPAEQDAVGYTRCGLPVLWVTPRFVLQGHPREKALTSAVVVHELGHQIYHFTDPDFADRLKGVSPVVRSIYNLVLDEHLERLLRAEYPEHGENLNLLATTCFLREQAPMNARVLLDLMDDTLFRKTDGRMIRLGPKPNTLLLNRNLQDLLLRQPRNAYQRFFLCLRMGWGNRFDDPRVARALELFGGRAFRQKTPGELLRLAFEIHKIFEDDPWMQQMENQEETVLGDPGEEAEGNRGLDENVLEKRIKAILRGQKKKKPSSGSETGKVHALWLNLGDAKAVKPIQGVRKMQASQEETRSLRSAVRAPARRLRDHFIQLGLDRETVGARVQGHGVDAPRLRHLILKHDPRVLRGRTQVLRTNLYVGVVIDCSGSMAYGDHMEKARRFSMLIAEATRGLPGIETHFWGFTHDMIFDVGDAERCQVAALKPTGGNNDAGALDFAARHAWQSKRTSRLLVMISDGLPTECTVATLRELVQTLTRKGFCCAQVAVHPLEEVCFPHHVVLNEPDLLLSVRKFGNLIAGLVLGLIKG